MDFRQRYGPWALILGASDGTGAAFAKRIAAAGVDCILVARRAAPLADLAGELRSRHGVACLTLTVDLSSDDAVPTIVEGVGDRAVGLLVANAGSDTVGSPFLDGDIADWDALVARNVVTTMRACHRFAPAMRERRRGGIVLIGSGAAYAGLPGIAAYAGTKAFGLCFGEALWAELRPHDVHVLNLVLGRTDTPSYGANLARRGEVVPDGLASPDDVADVGLRRLPHGPIHNWGLDDTEAGYAGLSAAARRDRVTGLAARDAGQDRPAATRREAGLALFEQVYGPDLAAGLARHLETDAFGVDLARWSNEFAFGTVWARDNIARRLRSCAVLGMMIALRQEKEIRHHTKMGLANGLTRTEIEAILQTAIPYCGFPAANVAKDAMLAGFAELDAAG